MASTVLNAYDKLPDTNSAVILLLGIMGVGKRQLARALVSTDTPFSLSIRTTASLPLPPANEVSRPRIDFVCFMVDMTNKESMKLVEKSTSKVDIEYFLGRSCLVANKVKDTSKNIIEVDQIQEFSAKYSMPALFAGSESESEQSGLAKRILSLVQIAVGFKPHISPMFLNISDLMFDASLQLEPW